MHRNVRDGCCRGWGKREFHAKARRREGAKGFVCLVNCHLTRAAGSAHDHQGAAEGDEIAGRANVVDNPAR